MAERSNAHDSKSCDAGMYPRVQIPFSAPNKKPASAGFLFGEEQITERDLRVEAFARANGLRNNDGNRWQERKLHTTVWCAPGRAAKGANPFLCATNSGGLLPAAVRVVGFERDLRVEAFAGANGLRNDDGNRWQERKLCRLLRSPIIQPASPPLPAFYFSKNSLFARASI